MVAPSRSCLSLLDSFTRMGANSCNRLRKGLQIAYFPRIAGWRNVSQSPTLKRFRSSAAGRVGAVALAVLVLVAVFAPLIAPYNPLAQVTISFLPPSADHLLGTDELGRDIASRIIFGLRLSMFTAVATASLAAVIGISIGLVSGYFGGWLDALMMRIIDVILSVPAILLAIVLVGIMGGGLFPMIIAIAIVAVPAYTRLTRASVLTIREREFVLAQRAAGASTPDLMLRTVLPNVLGPAAVQFIITAAIAVLTESGLSFLGLGAPPPSPSLGAMLAAGNDNLFIAPYYAVVVGLAIGVLVAAIDAFGAGLQRVFGEASARGGVAA